MGDWYIFPYLGASTYQVRGLELENVKNDCGSHFNCVVVLRVFFGPEIVYENTGLPSSWNHVK